MTLGDERKTEMKSDTAKYGSRKKAKRKRMYPWCFVLPGVGVNRLVQNFHESIVAFTGPGIVKIATNDASMRRSRVQSGMICMALELM